MPDSIHSRKIRRCKCTIHFKIFQRTTVEYISLPPVEGTAKIDKPVEETPQPVEIPDRVLTDKKQIQEPKERITYIYDTVFRSVDTTAILQDWLLKRTYEVNLISSDTLGSIDVTAQVQFNELQKLDYSFVPVQKQTTIPDKGRAFTPFVSATYHNAGSNIAVGGGMFYHNLGFGGEYAPANGDWSAGIKYKF